MNKSYTVQTELLIRKPIADVFNAIIDPAITTKFWFTKSSGKLEQGKQVEWTWEMYNVSTIADVKSIDENKSIVMEWGSPDARTTITWTFRPYQEKYTIISVEDSGYTGKDYEDLIVKLCGSTGGFNLVLAGLKAHLEFNIQLNLVGDRFPQGK